MVFLKDMPLTDMMVTRVVGRMGRDKGVVVQQDVEVYDVLSRVPADAVSGGKIGLTAESG